jgi:hypothetical protein
MAEPLAPRGELLFFAADRTRVCRMVAGRNDMVRVWKRKQETFFVTR